jgi:hypothetical protein
MVVTLIDTDLSASAEIHQDPGLQNHGHRNGSLPSCSLLLRRRGENILSADLLLPHPRQVSREMPDEKYLLNLCIPKIPRSQRVPGTVRAQA